MQQDKRALWDILDAHRIPFRTPVQTLLDEFGAYDDGWRLHGQFGSQDMISGLSTPFIFMAEPAAKKVIPPSHFSGYLRDSDDWAENFEKLSALATTRFGKGVAGGASNTKQVSWSYGSAHVIVRVFPPELQHFGGTNERHKLIPRSDVEASITVTPNWCKPATSQVLSWIEDYDQISPKSSVPFGIRPTSYALPYDETRTGFGLTRDGNALLSFSAEQVDVIETSQMHAVRYDRLLPAKGGGGAYVSISYMDGSDAAVTSLQLLFVYKKDDIPTVQAQAAALAKRLNIPLRTSEAYDC